MNGETKPKHLQNKKNKFLNRVQSLLLKNRAEFSLPPRVFTTTYADILGGHLPIHMGNILQGHLVEEPLEKDNILR